jgi:acetylornithine deacetylase
MAKYLGGFLEERGFGVAYQDVLPGRPNVIAKLNHGSGLPRLVFEGHLDTVGVDGVDDPFKAILKGGRVHGRGACDVKGGIASCMLALESLAAIHDLPLNIEFVGAADEEVGFQGVLAYLAGQVEGGAAVVIEPTSLVPVAAHAGVLRGRLRSTGVSVHSSMPTLGENAIDKMVASLATVEAWARTRVPNNHELTGSTAFSVTTIRGGQAINIIPRECFAEFDWRLSPDDDPAAALSDLTAFLHSSCRGIEVSEVLLQDTGLNTTPTARILKAAQAACMRITGHSTPTGVGWGSDASKFGRQQGWEAIVLGPGSVEQAHTNDEWIDVEELVLASELYTAVALELVAEA